MKLTKQGVLAIVLVISIVVSGSLTPLAWAQDKAAKQEYLEKRIVVKPIVSGKTVSTIESKKEQSLDSINVETEETTTTKVVSPSEVEGYKIYKGGTEIGVIEFLNIVGEEKRAEEVKNKIEKEKNILKGQKKMIKNLILYGQLQD